MVVVDMGMVTLVNYRSNLPFFLHLEQTMGHCGFLVVLMVDLAHLVESKVTDNEMYMDI